MQWIELPSCLFAVRDGSSIETWQDATLTLQVIDKLNFGQVSTPAWSAELRKVLSGLGWVISKFEQEQCTFSDTGTLDQFMETRLPGDQTVKQPLMKLLRGRIGAPQTPHFVGTIEEADTVPVLSGVVFLIESSGSGGLPTCSSFSVTAHLNLSVFSLARPALLKKLAPEKKPADQAAKQ